MIFFFTGNTSTFEYKYKRAPSSIEDIAFHIDLAGDEDSMEVIDWGDDGIDWGGDGNNEGEEKFEIVVESEEKLQEVPSGDVAKGNSNN